MINIRMNCYLMESFGTHQRTCHSFPLSSMCHFWNLYLLSFICSPQIFSKISLLLYRTCRIFLCVVGSFVRGVLGWIFGTEVCRADSDIVKSSVSNSLQYVYRHDRISSHRNCFIVCFDYKIFSL